MTAPAIRLYNSKNVNEFSAQNPQETEYYKALLQHHSSQCVENICAEMNILQVDDQIFPLLIASDNYQDSYVSSPYGHYISLALESMPLIRNKWLQSFAEKGIKMLGRFIKAANINYTVYINHSLLSTDLHPIQLSKEHIKYLVDFLKTAFPCHAILFRSINRGTCSKLHKELKSQRFKFIASRQIYLTEVKNPQLLHTRIIKSDLKHWKEKKHEVVSLNDFTDEDEENVLPLCHSLSHEHHSKLNPKANLQYLKLLKKHPFFQMKALKIGGKIEGVAGYFIKDNVLLCSLFGYDKHHPNKTHIYRLLSTLLLLEAVDKADVFHQSAGASFYKQIRRAKNFQEYQAVYAKHLKWKQKMAWVILRLVINTFAVPFMKKY